MFEQGDKVQLRNRPAKRPNTHGQGEYPSVMSVTVDGVTVELPFGELFKVSAYTTEPVASMDSTPLPLVNKSWANAHAEEFELVEKAED